MNRSPASNYDKTRDAMELAFLRYDQASMIDKFGLPHNPDYLYIPFVGTTYRVNRLTGRVEYPSGTAYIHADYNASMTIFDVLCDSKPACRLSGNYIPLTALKNTVQTAALGTDMFRREREFFTGRCPQLKKACEALGGTPQRVGDVSYQIPLFPFFPVILQFWDADDEFDSVLKFLWDENVLDYMHYETTFFAALHLLSRLKEASGL